MTPSTDYPDPATATWWSISARARISLLPTAEGGRSGPIWERYSPNHKLQEGIFCMGACTSIEGGHISPGESGVAEITFLVIGELTDRFKPGLVWKINEGGRTVGGGEILAVLSAAPSSRSVPKEAGEAAPPKPGAAAMDPSTAAWHKLVVEAEIALLPAAEGGRNHPVWENWSPSHVFADGTVCAGRLTQVNGEKIRPGEAGVARIEFSVPAPHHALLTPGAEWEIQERGSKVGTGRVRSVRRQTQPGCHWRTRE